MTFEEMLAQLRDAGEDGPPDTIYDDLTNLHTSEVSESQQALADALAHAAEQDGVIQQLQGEIANLQGQNGDLLNQLPSNDPTGEGEHMPDDSDPEDTPDEVTGSTLFETKES